MMQTRYGWFAMIAFIGLTQVPTVQPGRGRGAQPPSAPVRQPNTCSCVPPIAARATGFGACTRTQDDGTFCDLNFVSAAVTAGIAATPGFARFASQMKLSTPAGDLAPATQRVETNQVGGLSPAGIATSVRAVAAMAAYARQNDASARIHFGDILELTDPARLTQPVAGALQRYAQPVTAERAPVQRQQATVNGRRYDVSFSPGCLAFSEDSFVFHVNAVAEATPCAPSDGALAAR